MGSYNQMNELSLDISKALNEIKGILTKGVDDGQYYHEPFEIIHDPIGIGVQPQASPLVMDYRTPDKTYPSKNQFMDSESVMDELSCPYCARATLAPITGPEDVGADDVYRCINCGSLVSKQDMVDAQFLANLSDMMMNNPNVDNISSVPRWTPKSFNMNKDLDLDTKEYSCLDYEKFAGNYAEYAETKEYKRLLTTYLNDLPESMREQIIAILKVGIKENKSISQIKMEIDRVINDKPRAEVIARTEVIRIVNEANRRRMKDNGVDKVEWVAGPYDGRTCEICHANNGKLFTLQAIKNKIPQHPCCRCSFTEVFD